MSCYASGLRKTGERKVSGSRHVVLLAVFAGVLAIALALGAAERGAADTVGPSCAGKPLCVTIADSPDPASLSPVGSDHYLSESVTISNSGATSNLVNITVAVTWADVGAATTLAYVPAAGSACTETGAQTLTCTTPKSLTPGTSVTYPLVFRTATTTADPNDQEATATNVTVTAAAKEQTKPTKGGTNTAFVTVSNPTTYEPDAELDVSTAGGGLTTTLATANVGQQFSRLPVPAGGDLRLFELSETDDFSCPAGFNCFGQQVITVATGVSPVNLQTTYTGPLPAGTTENKVDILHVRDDATEITISADCGGALFSGAPPALEIPCRRVEITHLPGGIATVEIDTWDTTNGSFTGG